MCSQLGVDFWHLTLELCLACMQEHCSLISSSNRNQHSLSCRWSCTTPAGLCQTRMSVHRLDSQSRTGECKMPVYLWEVPVLSTSSGHARCAVTMDDEIGFARSLCDSHSACAQGAGLNGDATRKSCVPLQF